MKIQNAIEDTSRFNRSGITAILVYPMNSLANDQEDRIRELLKQSGHTGINVARYDRQKAAVPCRHGRGDSGFRRRVFPQALLPELARLQMSRVRPELTHHGTRSFRRRPDIGASREQVSH